MVEMNACGAIDTAAHLNSKVNKGFKDRCVQKTPYTVLWTESYADIHTLAKSSLTEKKNAEKRTFLYAFLESIYENSSKYAAVFLQD